MRVDLEALRQGLAHKLAAIKPALSGGKIAAASAALLAAATVVYVVWPKPEEVRVDAVVSTVAPIFTPVTWKPAVPAPSAAAPSPSDDGAPGRATDMRDPLSVTRAVQRRLKDADCYDGRVNGAWNAATRRGMAAFTEIVNARLPVDRPDPVLLVLLETHAGVTCTQATRAAARGEHTASVERIARHAPETQDREPVAHEIAATAPPGPAQAPSSESQAGEQVAAIENSATEGAATLPPEGAAAVAAAAGAHKVAKADRPRYKRKKIRRGPSFSRSFRKIQRSMNALFF